MKFLLSCRVSYWVLSHLAAMTMTVSPASFAAKNDDGQSFDRSAGQASDPAADFDFFVRHLQAFAHEIRDVGGIENVSREDILNLKKDLDRSREYFKHRSLSRYRFNEPVKFSPEQVAAYINTRLSHPEIAVLAVAMPTIMAVWIQADPSLITGLAYVRSNSPFSHPVAYGIRRTRNGLGHIALMVGGLFAEVLSGLLTNSGGASFNHDFSFLDRAEWSNALAIVSLQATFQNCQNLLAANSNTKD